MLKFFTPIQVIFLFLTFFLTSFHSNPDELYGTWKATSAYLGEDLEAQKEGLNTNRLELFKEIESVFTKDAYIQLNRNHTFKMQVGTIGKLNGSWKQEENKVILNSKQLHQDSLIAEIYSDKLVLLLLPEQSLEVTFTR